MINGTTFFLMKCTKDLYNGVESNLSKKNLHSKMTKYTIIHSTRKYLRRYANSTYKSTFVKNIFKVPLKKYV